MTSVVHDILFPEVPAGAFDEFEPGARAYYDRLRARGVSHRAALRQLGNRLVGVLHGCLKSGEEYDEAKAWASHQQDHDSQDQKVAA